MAPTVKEESRRRFPNENKTINGNERLLNNHGKDKEVVLSVIKGYDIPALFSVIRKNI